MKYEFGMLEQWIQIAQAHGIDSESKLPGPPVIDLMIKFEEGDILVKFQVLNYCGDRRASDDIINTMKMDLIHELKENVKGRIFLSLNENDEPKLLENLSVGSRPQWTLTFTREELLKMKNGKS